MIVRLINREYVTMPVQHLGIMLDPYEARDVNIDNFDDLNNLMMNLDPVRPVIALGLSATTQLPMTTSEPISDEMFKGHIQFWVNELTNDLNIKVKYSDGTIKSGSINLF